MAVPNAVKTDTGKDGNGNLSPKLNVFDDGIDVVAQISPDGKFIRDVVRLGGSSAKKCFQCGTCTATCNVAYAQQNGNSFPRKQMLWTQWGLRDRVLLDPGIWGCHQCQDCSATCPRGAKPGDVLAAVRALAIEQFSVPSFMARAYRDPKCLVLIFGIPALVLVTLLYLFRGLTFPSGEIVYAHFIPDMYVELAGFIVAGAAMLAAGLGLLRFWKGLRPVEAGATPGQDGAVDGSGSPAGETAGARGLEFSFASTMADIVKHTDFWTCGADRLRLYGHLAVFYGTPFLLFATALSAVRSWTGLEVQRPLDDPVKITGNLGALGLIAGVMILGYNRWRARGNSWGKATYFDWFFLWLIGVAAMTGVCLEVLRYSGLATAAYSLYVVHLVIVFGSFLYAPYGKFAHSFYRAAALTFIRHGGRAGPYKLYVLLPAALGVAVGAVAALVGLVVGVVWLVQAAPTLIKLPPLGIGSLSLYLPVANVSVSLPALLSVGFGVGVLSGMTGVGGGFLMTPLLMMVGVPASPAVGSDTTQIVGTSSSGGLAHWRLGNVDLRLGLAILAGSFVGGTLGVQIVAALQAIGNFGFWVRITYVVVLGTVGALMLRESVQTWIRSLRLKIINELIAEGFEQLRPKVVVADPDNDSTIGQFTAKWPLQTEFRTAKIRASLLAPVGLGFAVGLLAAIMGVGGGFILVPAMIYVLGVPTHVAVGTSLAQMVLTSANVGFQQAVVNHNVDVVLAILLSVGAAVGAQVGAKVGHQLEGHQLRTFLGIVVLLAMAKMLLDIVLPPDSLIGLSAGGPGG